MKSIDILEAIGSVDDEYIKKAKEHQKSKRNLWITLSSIAACIAAIIIIPLIISSMNNYSGFDGSSGNFFGSEGSSSTEGGFNSGNSSGIQSSGNGGASGNSSGIQSNGNGGNDVNSAENGNPETAIRYDDIEICFVDGDKIISESEFLPCIPEEIFGIWKQKNGIGDDVRFISVTINSNGVETELNGSIGYEAGDYFVYNLTISADIENYYDSTDSNLLLESLERTMTGFSDIEYDEFNLILK